MEGSGFSGMTDVNIGVPKGSILSSLLLIFNNDIPEDVLGSAVDMYADDTSLPHHGINDGGRIK